MLNTDTVLALKELPLSRHTNKPMCITIIELSALKGTEITHTDKSPRGRVRCVEG